MGFIHHLLGLPLFHCWLCLGGFFPYEKSQLQGDFCSLEPVPDAVNAEGSCFWVLGLFVIMIIKHLSTVYTMVYKYACSGLQTGERFLLPLERVAGIPWCSAASCLVGKTEAASVPCL